MPAASTASISSSSRPKTVGSPRFQPHDMGALRGVLDDQRVDLGLRHRGAEAFLAGVDQRAPRAGRVPGSRARPAGRGSPRRRASSARAGLQRQQFGVARAGADEIDMARGGGVAARCAASRSSSACSTAASPPSASGAGAGGRRSTRPRRRAAARPAADARPSGGSALPMRASRPVAGGQALLQLGLHRCAPAPGPRPRCRWRRSPGRGRRSRG